MELPKGVSRFYQIVNVKHNIYKKLLSIEPNFPCEIGKLVDVIMTTIDEQTQQKFLRLVDDSFPLRKLLLSTNQFCNGDTRPFGIMLSIFENEKTSQAVLNVKHLSVDGVGTAFTANTNPTILHKKTNNMTWWRLRLNGSYDVATSIIKKVLATDGLKFEIVRLSDEVCEVIYKSGTGESADGTTFHRYYLQFETLSAVKHIIFFSNTKDLIKFLPNNFTLHYSNTLKFLFCQGIFNCLYK